jgi:trimeric autotransporter adhesin
MERAYGRMTSATPRRVRTFALLAATFFAFASANYARATLTGTIDTYVGGGNGDGDAAINATLDPRGIALVGDPISPDIYVADGLNHRVRHVDARTGLIDTIAGNGIAGFGGDGGQGQNASLWLPLDVAVDSAGNVYIADSGNNRIRKVGTNGHISTFAGTGAPTYSGDGGLATQAAVNSPYGVAVGPDGNVYIADFGNNRIRKVSPPGCAPSTCVISTVAGTGAAGSGGDNGQAISATLRNPSDVTFDSAGSMYIAEYTGSRVDHRGERSGSTGRRQQRKYLYR